MFRFSIFRYSSITYYLFLIPYSVNLERSIADRVASQRFENYTNSHKLMLNFSDRDLRTDIVFWSVISCPVASERV
ncbi:MAG: hypothetical protein F6K17_16445 [Okeania sp. SIO3C4]|nr:hypothetical protein [Okeania sp. SIO3C4]